MGWTCIKQQIYYRDYTLKTHVSVKFSVPKRYNLRKRPQWNSDKSFTWLGIENNGHKDNHQVQENNAWTKWEHLQRDRNYKKEPAEVLEL